MIENGKIFGVYSANDLRTQIERYLKLIQVEQAKQKHILSDDFPLAKEYGEDVRQNHLNTSKLREKSHTQCLAKAQTWLKELENQNVNES